MDERHAFWKGYKYTIHALGAAIIIVLSAAAAIGDLNSVLVLGQGHTTNRVMIFQIIAISGVLIQSAMITIGSIFCFGKIIKLVWTTSSKIAKLLRTDDRPLVFALRRRMYAYISVLSFFSVVNVIEWYLQGVFYLCGLIILFQVALHFLEFVRAGVNDLDEYELRERSISVNIECEFVSQMESIEPMSPSEVESENEGQQRNHYFSRLR
jgi:hypothetical protein